MRPRDTPEELLAACVAAGRDGLGFPTIWNTILRDHPLVAGIPVQGREDGVPVLTVLLITNQYLVFDSKGFSIVSDIAANRGERAG